MDDFQNRISVKLDSLQGKIEDLGIKYNNLEEKVTVVFRDFVELKAELFKGDMEASVKTCESNTVASCINEMAERAKLQRKVVIYGVPDWVKGHYSEEYSVESDKSFFNSLFETVTPELAEKQFFASRIGTRNEAKKQPSTAQSEFAYTRGCQVGNIKSFVKRKKAEKIPDLIQNISMAVAKTKMQRQEYKAAKVQLEARKVRGEEGLSLSRRGAGFLRLDFARASRKRHKGRTNNQPFGIITW